MQRYSKKRQSIFEYLVSTKEHPDAEQIFTALRNKYPDLSLATVYRNLSQLKEEGLVRSVGTVDGRERFDADTSPHTHAVCVRCGKVTDVPDVSVPESAKAKFEGETGFSVIRADLTFSGLCEKCGKEMKNG